MLWWLVVPFAIMLIMTSWLLGSYAYVIGQSSAVSYEGIFGKISTGVSEVQKQIEELKKANGTLQENNLSLEKTVVLLKSSCQTAVINGVNSRTGALQFEEIDRNLKLQSELINKQSNTLNDVSKDVLQFQDEIQAYKKTDKK